MVLLLSLVHPWLWLLWYIRIMRHHTWAGGPTPGHNHGVQMVAERCEADAFLDLEG